MFLWGHSHWSIFLEGRLSHLEESLGFLQIRNKNHSVLPSAEIQCLRSKVLNYNVFPLGDITGPWGLDIIMSLRGHSHWSIFFEGRLSHLEDALGFLQNRVQDSPPDIRDFSLPYWGGGLSKLVGSHQLGDIKL